MSRLVLFPSHALPRASVRTMLISVDYPMSASLAGEKSVFGSRAKLILTVFACIGCGGITASIVNTILIVAGKSSIEKDIKHLEWVWRILLGLGIVPALATLYARFTMRESGPYEKCGSTLHLPSHERLLMVNRRRYGDWSHWCRQARNQRAIRRLSSVLSRAEACSSPLCRFSRVVPLVSQTLIAQC